MSSDIAVVSLVSFSANACFSIHPPLAAPLLVSTLDYKLLVAVLSTTTTLHVLRHTYDGESQFQHDTLSLNVLLRHNFSQKRWNLLNLSPLPAVSCNLSRISAISSFPFFIPFLPSHILDLSSTWTLFALYHPSPYFSSLILMFHYILPSIYWQTSQLSIILIPHRYIFNVYPNCSC